jgi:hypothetical protein
MIKSSIATKGVGLLEINKITSHMQAFSLLTSTLNGRVLSM